MSREIYGPSVSTVGRVQPTIRGGTGTDTLSQAAGILGLIDNSKKGVDGGVISLDGTGKLPATSFPSSLGINNVNVTGNFTPVIGTTNTFQITDYDSSRSYTVSASAGSISISADTITYIAPATVQNATMVVNGRSIALSILAAQPQQPTITSPTSGAVNQPASGVGFNGSAFVPQGDSSTHSSSDWQVATDSAFTNVVSSSINDTVNKTSWTSAALSFSTTYYARVRYKASNGNYSAYSPTVSFVTGSTLFSGIEEAKLAASDFSATAQFGYSVAIDSTGTRVVVGANQTEPTGVSNSGGCYIFIRNGSTWTQEAVLVPSGVLTSSFYGNAVAIDSTGTRVVLTSSNIAATNKGSVCIFLRTGTTWAQEAIFTASDTAAGDYFGSAVSMTSDGSRIIVGAHSASNGSISCGAAYIFSRTGTTWTQEKKMQPSDANGNDKYGYAVSISGDGSRAIIGAYSKTVNVAAQGEIYIWVRSGTSWSQELALAGPVSTVQMRFGYSVSMDNTGTRVAIGAYSNNVSAVSTGTTYIYLRTGTTWAQEANLSASDYTANMNFGYSVSISSDGSRVLVGASNGNSNTVTTSGIAYTFTRNGTTWTQESKMQPSDPLATGMYGAAVALAANSIRAAIGAYQATVSSVLKAGACYMDR